MKNCKVDLLKKQRSLKNNLVGVGGNAFSIMGYTAKALRQEGLRNLIDEMRTKATSGDYNNLLRVCMEYIDLANQTATEEDVEEQLF